jgi:hypothetical protein
VHAGLGLAGQLAERTGRELRDLQATQLRAGQQELAPVGRELRREEVATGDKTCVDQLHTRAICTSKTTEPQDGRRDDDVGTEHRARELQATCTVTRLDSDWLAVQTR